MRIEAQQLLKVIFGLIILGVIFGLVAYYLSTRSPELTPVEAPATDDIEANRLRILETLKSNRPNPMTQEERGEILETLKATAASRQISPSERQQMLDTLKAK